MTVLVGSVNCKRCNGDQSYPAWYMNEAEQKVSFHYDLCPCTGKSSHRPGERDVDEKEYNRLKLLWEKPAPPADLSFQAAA